MGCSWFAERRHRAAIAGIAIAAVTAIGWICWDLLFPFCFPMRPEELNRFTPARRFYDRAGEAVHTMRGDDYRFQFPVRLADLPPHLITVTLAAEDRNFFRHDGVDPAAVCRAFRQLLFHGRIVSGASTITMQLVAMIDGRERSLSRKIRQMGRARSLERKLDKQAILEAYFNLLPYGGKLHGIGAAASYYFGRPPRELNFAEAVLLAGIPQQPNRLRPDRHPEAAKRRMETVLAMLVRQGLLSENDVRAVLQLPLRFRDFGKPLWPISEDPQFFQLVRKRHPERTGYRTTLDSELQTLGRAILRDALAPVENVRDGALVILESATGKVRTLIGTLDYNDPRAGQVNAALARRSPGSALKPFLYGEAIDGGMLCAETLLDDTPLSLPDYRPGNFDGTFHGRVPAGEALADSLNTPAIRVLAALGVERVLRQLNRFGLPMGKLQSERIGLSLALGGAETDLLNLAGAYAAIARGGIFLPCRFLEDEPEPAAYRIWRPGTAALTLRMLRQRPLPGAAGVDAAWKTGTSNNSRDAWCIATSPEWTVAVWCGNKDGSSAPELVGGTLAAPIAGRVMRSLYRQTPPPRWHDEELLRTAMLCAQSGLAPTESCTQLQPGTTAADVPLQRCRICRNLSGGNSGEKPTRILSPAPGNYHADTSGRARFRLESEPAELHWYLDGNYLGIRRAGSYLELPPGQHRLFGWGGSGFRGDSVELLIRPRKEAYNSGTTAAER